MSTVAPDHSTCTYMYERVYVCVRVDTWLFTSSFVWGCPEYTHIFDQFICVYIRIATQCFPIGPVGWTAISNSIKLQLHAFPSVLLDGPPSQNELQTSKLSCLTILHFIDCLKDTAALLPDAS